MSGPKVVTIVTREELIDLCRGLIAALESAVQRWEHAGTRAGVVSEEEIAASRRRISDTLELLKNDRFIEIQTLVPAEISFLDRDIEQLAQKAARKAAAARERFRRSLAAAQMLRSELVSRGLEVPEVLQSPDRHAAVEIESAVAQAFASLTPKEAPQGISDRQKELAAFLGGDEARPSLVDWLKRLHVEEVDPSLLALEARLDELSVLDAVSFEELKQSLAEVAAEQTPSRRTLLADSLTLNIANARRTALSRMASLAELEDLRAQAETLDYGSSADLLSEIRSALENAANGKSDPAKSIAEFRLAVARLKDEKVAMQRRKALLQGLGELGYEIREGMETAWIENGRVVLGGGSRPGYGIEIGGNPDVALQVRTVAFNPVEARTAQADIEAEETFCEEFSTLRNRLLTGGGGVGIVRALGVGQARVKSVDPVTTTRAEDAFDIDVSQSTVQLSPR